VYRFRWLTLQIGLAALLFGAAFSALQSPSLAAVLRQEDKAEGERVRMPVPAGNWLGPVVLPTVTPTIGTAAGDEGAEGITATVEVSGSAGITASAEVTVTGPATYYVVKRGDTLFVIARDHGVSMEAIMEANGLRNPNILEVGQLLLLPNGDGELPDPELAPVVMADGTVTESVVAARGTITERMTSLAQQVNSKSPYYGTTWLTYYGRPNIDVMGILGEHSIADLVPILRAEAEAYERANGEHLQVKPAFHLVYGMATKAPGDDGSHLAYLSETEVISYITAAEEEGWAVILDVQIGALSPTLAISPALAYLKYPNVHLAIDPEFAMAHEGQAVPGNPIGFVTGDQVNEVQKVINEYLVQEGLPGPRILLVHQFQSNMIVDKEKLDASRYPNVALTLSVDGWGGPWAKVSKYNSLVTSESPFTAFKLFYRWDEPILSPDEALGNRPFPGADYLIEITPNLIIYQ
jgi:LysM repeat protein